MNSGSKPGVPANVADRVGVTTSQRSAASFRGTGVEPALFYLVALKPTASFAVAVSLGEQLGQFTGYGIPRWWIAATSAVCTVCALWIRGSAGGGTAVRAGWCRLVSWLWILAGAVFGRVAMQVQWGYDPVPVWPLLLLVILPGLLALYRVGKTSPAWRLRALAMSVVVLLAALPPGMWSPVHVLPFVALALASVSACGVLSVVVCRQ